MSEALIPKLTGRVAQILGWTPDVWRAVVGGYTPAARYVVTSGRRSAFVKVATSPLTATMLRREIVAYGVVDGRFRPQLIGAQDDATQPILVIEDLGGAYWPPPWRDADVDAVLSRIDALHRSSAELPQYDALHGDREPGWATVASQPAAFLSLRLASAAWLSRALPALVEAEAACATDGEAPSHWDIRSDNLCLGGDGARLVDWAEACLSNPTLDLGFWLPSLAYEGGPPPESILGAAPEIAAWVSGFFAARAGLGEIADAPFVRRVQREQLSTALPWAQRVLRLPPLDG